MGDDRSGRVLRIDVVPFFEQFRVLLSPECQREIASGATEPDTLLGAECSAEVGVLQADPALVRNVQSLVEKCAPTIGPRAREQAGQCLDAVLKDQKRVMHRTIAAREITDYCQERYDASAETVLACRDFGQGYLTRDVDLTRVHGYTAARVFEQGVERLTAGATPEMQRSIEATALRMAYHLYESSRIHGEDTAISFGEAIAAAQEKLAGLRDAGQSLDRARAERAARERAEAEKRARPEPPMRAPTPTVPTPTIDPQRRAWEAKMLSQCVGLLDRYLATAHPILKALEMTVPPHATLYLRALVVDAMETTIVGLKSDAPAGPSAVLGAAVQDLHGTIVVNQIDRIARLHYAALGKSDVYDRLSEVGFSAKLNLFTYQGNTYKFQELPAEAKPLAEIMRTTDLWMVMQNEDAVFKETVQGARRWLSQTATMIRLPSQDALRLGTYRARTPNLFLSEAAWRKLVDGLLQK